MTRSWPTLHAGRVEDHWARQQRKGPGSTHAGEGLGFREWRSLPLMAQRRLIEAVEPSRCPLLTQSGHSRPTIAAVQLEPAPHFIDRKSLLNRRCYWRGPKP